MEGRDRSNGPTRNQSRGLTERLIRLGCACLRLYFRHMPIEAGKAVLWDRLVHRRLARYKMTFEAQTRFGARFIGDFPDTIQMYLYFFGVWEPTITAYYRTLLRPGDTVIDIGANVGAHALLAAHLVGPSGTVHAIEASPSIYARLQRNIARNGVGNVTAHLFAVTDLPCHVMVYLADARNIGGTTIIATEAERRDTVQEAVVEGRQLSYIVPLHALRAARLIKIDVEGAEWLVVNGMRDLLPLLRDDAEILLEVSPPALAATGGSVDALIALFSAAGFSAFEIVNDYRPSFYIAKPPLTIVPFVVRDFDLADLIFRRVR